MSIDQCVSVAFQAIHERDKRYLGRIACGMKHGFAEERAPDRDAVEPARQLAEFIDRPVLWFWGHEHRLAFYGKWAGKKGIEAFGRCVGHGGMPIQDYDKRPKKNYQSRRLVTYDARFNRRAGPIPVGFNGYVNLTFEGNRLSIDYRDVKDRSLLTEKWAVDPASGALKGRGVEQHEKLDVPKDLNLPGVNAAQR